jgi:GWxTD domain-containing protein
MKSCSLSWVRFRSPLLLGMAAAVLVVPTVPAQSSSQSASSDDGTVSKPLSKKEQKRREKALRKELEGPWKKWLNEDVVYIITDEERNAFKHLQTDEEREQFVEGFWKRRDPTPDTEENEYKEELYRRIAYANEHYASGIPGWKTDRGMIYIKYGPADEVDSHPSGGSYQRPYQEGGGETSTYPFEDWRYRYLDGIGSDINIEFVDTTMTGEYHMTMDPSEKDALLYVPGAGLTMNEQMGLSSKTDRFNRTDGTHLGTGTQPLSQNMDEFSRLEQFAKLQKAPVIKFKDLQAVVDSTIKYNSLPMKVRADYIKVTDATVLANITISFNRNDLQYQTKDKISKATVNLYGRITTLSRRTVNWFEEPVQVELPAEMLQKAMDGQSIYFKSVPLQPGTYRLNVVAKDTVGGTMNNFEMPLHVPQYDEDTIGSSSLILADQIEKLPTSSVGAGPFVIRSSKVRPRVGESFKQGEKMGIYTEFYNLGMDAKTKKPSGNISYEIVNDATNQKVVDVTQDIATVPNASPSLVTVERMLPLSTFTPGAYTLKIILTDKLKNQTVNQTAKFTVRS